MTITREMIAAYADGELDSNAAREVEAALAGDPQLQAQLAGHRALKARLAAHFAPMAEQPVPAQLLQAVHAAGDETKVIDFASAVPVSRRLNQPHGWARMAGLALAASLVLAVVGVGFGLRPSSNYADGKVASALENQLAVAQSATAPVRILLTFRDREGRYCRGYSSRSEAGIACRDDSGWRLVKRAKGAASTTGEYRQAGSGDEAIMAAIQDMADGAGLDAGQEQEMRRAHWRR